MRLYFSRIEQIVVAVILVGILGAVLVLSYTHGRRQREAPVPFYQSSGSSAIATPPTVADPNMGVVVHVTGAVKHPGVYTLPSWSRIQDALAKAGGPRADAYPDALNLAARLEDGERICVPTKTEWRALVATQPAPTLVTTPPPPTSGRTSPPRNAPTPSAQPYAGLVTTGPAAPPPAAPPVPEHAAPTPASASGPIAINTATPEELDRLPGIGMALAQRIIAYRQQHGRFTSIDDLQNVEGIGEKTLERLRPLITL